MSNENKLPFDDQPSGEPFEAPKVEGSLSGAVHRYVAYFYTKYLRDLLEEGDEDHLKRATQHYRDGNVEFGKPKVEGEEGQQGGGEKSKG